MKQIFSQSEALPGSGKFLVSLRIPVLITHSDIISWGNQWWHHEMLDMSAGISTPNKISI